MADFWQLGTAIVGITAAVIYRPVIFRNSPRSQPSGFGVSKYLDNDAAERDRVVEEVKHATREVRIPSKGSRFNPPSRLPHRLPSFPPELVTHVGTRMTRIGAHIPGAWAY